MSHNLCLYNPASFCKVCSFSYTHSYCAFIYMFLYTMYSTGFIFSLIHIIFFSKLEGLGIEHPALWSAGNHHTHRTKPTEWMLTQSDHFHPSIHSLQAVRGVKSAAFLLQGYRDKQLFYWAALDLHATRNKSYIFDKVFCLQLCTDLCSAIKTLKGWQQSQQEPQRTFTGPFSGCLCERSKSGHSWHGREQHLIMSVSIL